MALIQEYYNIAGANRSDSLMQLVHRFNNINDELSKMKSGYSQYIVLAAGESGNLIPVVDESNRDAAERLMKAIDAKAVERDAILCKINRIGNLLMAADEQLPLLDHLQRKLKGYQDSIRNFERKITTKRAAMMTGRSWRMEAHENELQQMQDEYIVYAEKLQPEINKLDNLISEINKILAE